jgi:Na+-driven multidrug efflux pump
VAKAFGAALVYCLVYTLMVWAAMAVLGDRIAASFGLSDEGAAVVRTFTHYAAGSFIFTGALFVANASFNNLGRPLWSTGANWLRDGVMMYPAALVLGAAFAGPGVIWAQALVNVVAGALAAWLAWRYIRFLGRRRDQAATAAAD